MKDFFQKLWEILKLKRSSWNEINKWEEKNKRKDLLYKTNKYKYDIQQYEKIRSLGESIYTDKVNIDKPEMDQSNLLEKC